MVIFWGLLIIVSVVYVPEVFDGKPDFVKNLFGSSISMGGLTAIILSCLLPNSSASKELTPETEN